MEDIRKEKAKDLRRSHGSKNIRRSSWPTDSKSQRRYLVFSAIGIVVLIVILVLFSGGDNEVSVEDFNTMKAKLGELEKKLTELEGIDLKIVRLEKQVKKLKQSMSKLNRSVASKTSKRRYHVVRRGDSLSRIAQQYGISVSILCRLNQITPKTVIRPGQKLLVTSGSQ